MKKQTRTPETEDYYIKRAINLSIKAMREAKSKGFDTKKYEVELIKDGRSFSGMHIVALSKWATARWVRNLSPHTWRSYRSAIYYYAHHQLTNGEITSAMVELVQDEMSNKSHLNNKSSVNTSAKKMKHFRDGDLEAIIKSLMQSKAANALALSNWIYSNILVGLRPIEWKTVQVVRLGQTEALIVKNAKNTNNRAHGEKRVIKLKSFTPKQQRSIIGFANHCSALNERGEFDKFYSDCRKILQRTCKKLWKSRKKNITLYTTRHQFSADLKKSGRSLVEIAYLMGHLSTETATAHYGKRRYGKNRRTPEVDISLTQSIKKKNRKFSFSNKTKQLNT